MKSEDLYHVEDGYNGYPSCCEDADYAYEEEEDSYGCGNRVQESVNVQEIIKMLNVQDQVHPRCHPRLQKVSGSGPDLVAASSFASTYTLPLLQQP